MKNKLSDLNNHLFAQLERLNSEDLKGEALQEERVESGTMTDNEFEIFKMQKKTNIQGMGFVEVLSGIKSLMENDCSYWRITGVVDKPVGTRQFCESDMFDHEYVDQHAGPCEDDYYGSIFLPVGDGQYIQVEFNY